MSAFRTAWRNVFIHDVATVVVAYGLGFVGLRWWPPAAGSAGDAPVLVLLGVVMVFTLSHSVLPAFIYGLFSEGGRRHWFVNVHMAFWYGVPTIVVSALTGWLALPVAAVHVAVSPAGTRLWRAVAYGSAFFALLLLTVTTALRPLSAPPWYLVVTLAYQMALLRLQGHLARKHFLLLESAGK